MKTTFRIPPAVRALGAAVFLGACAGHGDLDEPVEPIGDFRLGHNIVVADDVRQGPFSRDATPEEWEAALTEAIDERLGRFRGDKYYHVAVKVDGFVLAVPGVPLVADPKSLLVIRVTLWDDEKGTKINDEPEQLTVFEDISTETIISSGLTQPREEQLRNLARNAARAIENWLEDNPDWFGPPPAPADDAETRDDAAATAPGAPGPEDETSAEQGETGQPPTDA